MDCQQVAKTVGWLGETWGFWLQTGAFFVSALAGVFVIYNNGRQHKTRSLIDLIIQQKSDKELLDATSLVYSLHATREQFSKYLNEKESVERKAILKVLNNQEFIAAGIRKKVFAEDIYKQLQCSNVLKVWGSSCGFITELRVAEGGRNTLFQDFEWLSTKWTAQPLAEANRRRWWHIG